MNNVIDRREFLATTAAAGTVLPYAATLLAGTETTPTIKPGGFRLNYAPHFGMFQHSAGEDLLDQIHFMAEHGFMVLEETGLKQRPPELQRRIHSEMLRLGMSMGLFSGVVDFGNPSFVSGRSDLYSQVIREIRDSVETAHRMKARWFTVVPGKADPDLPRTIQFRNALETLKRCAEICESAGVVMLLEPLSQREGSQKLFLNSLPQAAKICRAVNSPSCRVLFDVYEQSHYSENLIPLIDHYWDVIGYFQVGDNPGRKEPGTGNIAYREIFRHLYARGYTGIVGMDHGNSLPGEAGELAVLEAYQEAGDRKQKAGSRKQEAGVRKQLREGGVGR